MSIGHEKRWRRFQGRGGIPYSATASGSMQGGSPPAVVAIEFDPAPPAGFYLSGWRLLVSHDETHLIGVELGMVRFLDAAISHNVEVGGVAEDRVFGFLIGEHLTPNDLNRRAEAQHYGETLYMIRPSVCVSALLGGDFGALLTGTLRPYNERRAIGA